MKRCLTLSTIFLLANLCQSVKIKDAKEKTDAYLTTAFVIKWNSHSKWLGYHFLCHGFSLYKNPNKCSTRDDTWGCHYLSYNNIITDHLRDRDMVDVMSRIYYHTISQQGYDVDMFWHLFLLGAKDFELMNMLQLPRTEEGKITLPNPGCKEESCQYVLEDIKTYDMSPEQCERFLLFAEDLHFHIWGRPAGTKYRRQYDYYTLAMFSRTRLLKDDEKTDKVKEVTQRLKVDIQNWQSHSDYSATTNFAQFLDYRQQLETMFEKDMDNAKEDERKSQIRQHLEWHRLMTAMMMHGWFIAHDQPVEDKLKLDTHVFDVPAIDLED